MGAEKTVIKNAKGDGGIVGLPRKKPDLIRSTLSRHIAAQYSAEMEEEVGLSLCSSARKGSINETR